MTRGDHLACSCVICVPPTPGVELTPTEEALEAALARAAAAEARVVELERGLVAERSLRGSDRLGYEQAIRDAGRNERAAAVAWLRHVAANVYGASAAAREALRSEADELEHGVHLEHFPGGAR